MVDLSESTQLVVDCLSRNDKFVLTNVVRQVLLGLFAQVIEGNCDTYEFVGLAGKVVFIA